MARIVVLDDDPVLVSLLYDVFADSDWDMLSFPISEDAVARVREAHPDVILLDILLGVAPVGWDVLTLLVTDPITRSVPLVVWSAALDHLREKEVWLRERRIGMLAKPFDLTDLFAALQAAMLHEARYR
jgi:CheY-like chemotaxis protein